ncbi:hypothetical protein BDM02DRAFT_3190961 [Thelephora ganbajun]|uniref:Uncharacterized protein n=1 Tax=Thelephora ganbajun TaxID=370292 RepID=A0ACB6Z3A4_THEGA|nr:hypothetical protein BDM02DRAFT_3190961 [Thelephora ganbajun]
MEGREELLNGRLLQLEEISQRRKVLLGELYHVLKGCVYGGLEDTGEDGLPTFLAHFDFESDIHRGSIANLDEWIHGLPDPFDDETEEKDVQEVSQQPEMLEILEQDDEGSGPSIGSIAEPVQSQLIQVLSDTEDFEYHTTPPSQELELHKETSPTNLAPTEIVPPTPTPITEEVRSASPIFDSQLFPSTPLNPSPAFVTSNFEEEQDAIVDVMNISDEEEAQSSDSHNDNFPRTPSPTILNIIDTALLYRGPDQPMIVAPPSPVHDPQYNFDAEFSFDSVKRPVKNELSYTLPLLNSLPPEFRKKTTRTQRKREKERERTEVRKEKEEWVPMGMARWRALLRANPTWQHLARSTKSLTTKDWNVALTELRLIRTFDRIDMLKDSGRWSFRQPKKQRVLGGLIKTHWDYLMDEMKWMRIDFREERKWKIAVAYTIALAVQEWHEAGSTEERIRRGICVVWSNNLEEDMPVPSNVEGSSAMTIHDLPHHRLRSDSVQVVEESDDGSDEEEKDNAIPIDTDTVEPEGIVQAELTQEPENMKVEDNFDFTTALQAAPTTESQDQAGTGVHSSRQDSRESSDPTPPGLRVTSENPMMSFANNGLSAATQGAMRERVAFMDSNKVFLDADGLGLTSLIPKPSAEEAPDYVPPTIDLVALFGDVQAYGLPEPVPVAVQLDLKKNRREREDVSRRLDETNVTKLVPVSKFMFCRPTLISALQPSRHWRDGTWTGLDDSPVCPTDVPPFSQEFTCSLFERNSYNHLIIRPPASDPKRMQESRIGDQLWTPQDDQLLKNLVETYGNNWHLIADCFNSMRYVVSTDIRTNWDCYHRFAAVNAKPQELDTSSNQMTTRTKRQSTLGLDTNGLNVDNKKRRRHLVVLDAIRRLVKKKDSVAKMLAAQTKRQTGIHETHHQINNMPKLTPQDLSRKKEYSDLVLRRQAEEVRNRQLREQQARLQGAAGGATVNRATLQFSNGVGQNVPQIRGQVNISQQQRLAAALQHQLSQGSARMSPQQQQLVQAQVRALEAQQAHAQAQGQQVQTPAPQQLQPGQTQPQQPAIQIQTHNLPAQPAAQPLITTIPLANGTSASPPPQQAVSSTSGTPVSVNGNSNGSANGNGGAVTQRPASVQNQEATATPSPLDPDTATAITSISARPVAYYNAIQTLQSMFEINDGVTVNPNGSAQTRFQATPQGALRQQPPSQQQQTQSSPPQNHTQAASYPPQS